MIIAVAGAAGGMGRTMTALGLASAAAAEGHDTVLVDGDPHNHDAAAAARSVTALAEILGRTPPLRILPLGWEETVRWARSESRSGQVSILDLSSVNQEAVLAVAQAVVVPVPVSGRKVLSSLFPTRFQLVAAESGAPCFALVHSVNPRLAVHDDEVTDNHVQLLRAQIPYSKRIRQIFDTGSPWDSDWVLFAKIFAPAWAELRERLSLPVPAGPGSA
ncbi:hypothetical protein AB0N88_33075 [Streptomyces sp. NPDC093516]|uniref:nucleotide-binding protein n=1 Tax=Streptomyces sp. NPDC093516 TaxID=3155304 RepID=UPI00343C3071